MINFEIIISFTINYSFHLDCLLSESSNGTLDFKYSLKPGITPVKNYGIAVLKMSSYPKSIIENAEQIAEQLSSKIQVHSLNIIY